MHRSRIGGYLIDCQGDELEAAAEFWSAALGYPREPRAAGSRYISLQTPGRELYTAVQAVDHESRIHIDIETDNIEAEVKRLEQLGAREVSRVKDWVVMAAPTGHRFCVVPVESEHFDSTARRWN